MPHESAEQKENNLSNITFVREGISKPSKDPGNNQRNVPLITSNLLPSLKQVLNLRVSF